ncbi:MAG: hypothetical protein QXP27_07185 [Candidatus Methanomethyliaceae archaeon]
MTLVMKDTAKDQNPATVAAPPAVNAFLAQAPGLIIMTGFARGQILPVNKVVLGLIKRIPALRLIPVILEKLV